MIAMDGQRAEPAPPPAEKTAPEVTRQKRIRNASRWADDTSNACIKESELSLKCIMDNDFDRDKCSLFFQNYRNCLDFWKRVYRDRRRAGVQPAMPPAEERDAIKAEYYRRSQAQMKH
jgi:cytochrome c oxidase assembly protein subunit 23